MKTEDQQIETELDKARKRLLDLSLRNRLLNFRQTKRSTIQLVHEVPDEVFTRLVADQTQMLFKPVAKRAESSTEAAKDDKVAKEDIAFDEATKKDKFLQTDLPSTPLEQRLLHIKQKSDTVFEEQGYTVLYLALGFLEWKEREDSDVLHQAPLVLIPVMIERPTVGSAFRLKWTEEELATNVSLQAKLDELGLKLPDFELPEENTPTVLSDYFQKVRRTVSRREGWRVTDDIHLGFFSFTKFVMYKDLTPQDKTKLNWIVGHQLLRSVFTGDKSEKQGNGVETSEFMEDERQVAMLPVRTQFQVMDADASQVAVIEAVKKGKSLVVEGPSGTGKSQTITNIISELLVAGKRVLFVSEKMAALEVVKDRLDQCGLGDSCLELHSRHSNKRTVLEEIQRTIKVRPPAVAQEGRKFEDRERLASDLNEYVEVLSKEVGVMKRTPFSLFGQYVRARQELEKRGRKRWHQDIEGVDQLSESDYVSGKTRLKDLAEVIPVLRPIFQNPWRFCDPAGVILDSDRDTVGRMLVEALASLEEVRAALQSLNAVAGTGAPESGEGCQLAVIAAEHMSKAPSVEAAVLLDDRWNTPSKDSEQLLASLQLLQERVASLESRWVLPFGTQAIAPFRKEVEECKGVLEQLKKSCARLSELSGTYAPETLQASGHALSSAKTIATGYPAEAAVLLSAAWNKENPTAIRLTDTVKRVQSEKPFLEDTLTADAFSVSANALHAELEPLSRSLLRFVQPKFWKLRKSALAMHKAKVSLPQLVANLKRLSDFQDDKKEVESKHDEAVALFGNHWKGQDSDVELLTGFMGWVVEFRSCVLEGYLTERAVALASEGPDRQQLETTIKETDTLLQQARQSLDTVSAKLGLARLGLDEEVLDCIQLSKINDSLGCCRFSGQSPKLIAPPRTALG